MSALGKYIRTKRENLHKQYGQFSIRTLAKRIGIHQSYLSKLERGERAPLTEDRIMALARELGEDHDLLLALSGKLSDRVTRLIHDNPERFTQCLLELECSSSRDVPANTYTHRLEHRKQELETLTRMLRDEINTRVHLQHQLARAEAEKLTILSNLKDVVVEYLDRDFNLLWASPAIAEYLPVPMEQAIGQKCYRIIMGRDSVCPECTAGLAIRTGRIEDGQRTTADGRHWQVRSVPIKDALGQVEKVVHFGFDITELIRTRDALAESERRWRFALEGAQEGVWDWDTRTNKVFYSPRWKEMLGYAVEDIGDDLREWDVRIHPDDRREVYEILGRHLRGETDSYECEHRLRCKDGSYKWILDRGVVVERDPDNKPVRAIGTHFDITDRREAEETIRRSEERQALLAAIIDNSPNICVIKDLDRRVVATNQAFAAVAGKPLAELIGRTDAQIFGLSPDQPPVQGYMHDELEVQGYRPGQVLDREEELVLPDGSRRLVHTRKFPVFNPHGHVVATANISVDITEKAKALARCSVLAQRCQDLIHNAPVGIYAADANGHFLHINQAMAAMHGYASIQDMLTAADSHEQLFARPEDWPRLAAILDRQDVVSGFEAVIHRQDGSTLWTSRTVRAVRDAAGNRIHYEAFVESIQDRKEAEVLSDHARRLLLGVLEQLEAGLYVVNPGDRRIMFANRYLIRAFGRDLTGLDAPQTLLKDPAQCQFLGANPAFRANGDTLSSEMHFANDRWYLCAAKITPWIDTDKVVLVVAVDMTQARLAATVREEMDRIMRHDLRSPLNGIINLPLMLAETSELTEGDRCLLQAISDSGRKMLRLIDSSLALYRLESGTYILDRGPLNLDEEFRKTEHELLHLVRAKQLAIAYEHHPARSSGQPALIHADTITVPFLISNLMKNAVEAAPDNTTVTVRIDFDHDLEVAIHNSGEVPAEIQDRFFDKYTTSGKANGTGLGTYSAQLIVRAHGGEITMTTSAVLGTTVRFSLPAVGHRHSTEEN